MLLVVLASGGSAPAPRVAETGGLTATALAVIAIFAVLVIFAILYGMRQKRKRVSAQEEEKQRAVELTAQGEAAVPVPAVPPSPPPAPPVAAVAAPAPAPKAAKPAAAPKAAPNPRTEPAVAEPAPAPVPAPAPTPTPPPAPAPTPATERAPEPTAAGYALTDVKGLGPKAAALLTGLGIADVAALAALDPVRAAEVDGQLGTFAGRLTRDRWVEQARLLAADDIAGFEAAYGKL